MISLVVPFPSYAVWPIPFFAGLFDLVSGVFLFLYATFLESTRGATIGKQIMYLKVTTKEGNLPTLDKALIRDISKIHPLLWLIDTLIGMATVGDTHQKYSDRFAGTAVVSTITKGLIFPFPSQPSPIPPST